MRDTERRLLVAVADCVCWLCEHARGSTPGETDPLEETDILEAIEAIREQDLIDQEFLVMEQQAMQGDDEISPG